MKPIKHYHQNELFDYINDLVDKKKKITIKNHLKRCKLCKDQVKNLLKTTMVISNTPIKEIPNRINYILQEVKKREKGKEFNWEWIKDTGTLFKRFKIQIALAVSILLCVGIFLIPRTGNKIYFTKVAGKVNVNQQPFHLENHYQFNLNEKLNIQTLQGSCIVQVKGEKLILIGKNTKLYYTNNFMRLHEGEIICSVNKMNPRKPLIIEVGPVHLKVIGTKFFAEKKLNVIKMGMEEGKIEVTYKEKTHTIKPQEFFMLKNREIHFGKITSEKAELFNILNEVPFIKNIKVKKFIHIQTIPPQGQLYQDEKPIDDLPIYSAIPFRKNKVYTIVKEGYIPQEINFNNQNKIFEVILERQRAPEILWNFNLKTTTSSKPLLVKNFLIIPGLNGIVYKFDINNKKIIWSFKTKNRINITPFLNNHILYFSSNDDFLYAINFHTAQLIWKKKIGTLSYSQPVLFKDKIYFANTSGLFYCLNSINGKTIWSKKFVKGFFSSPLLYKNNLYIGNLDGYLYAININNQKIVWKYKSLRRIVSSTPLIINNTLFFGSNDKYLYAINIASGKLKWKYKTDSPLFTSPLSFNKNIIIASEKGCVYAIELDTGKLKWSFYLKGQILSDPLLFNNQYILVHDKKNNFYLINHLGIPYFNFVYPVTSYITHDNEIIVSGKNYKILNFIFDRD